MINPTNFLNKMVPLSKITLEVSTKQNSSNNSIKTMKEKNSPLENSNCQKNHFKNIMNKYSNIYTKSSEKSKNKNFKQ